MALPKLTTPTYELEVPSSDEKIQYRPFLVKEEKILLIAMESNKPEDIIEAVKQIVSECTFNKLDLGVMPMFDVEYIFLQIRSKSVGEVSKLKLLCPDDNKTYGEVEVKLDEEVETHLAYIDHDKKRIQYKLSMFHKEKKYLAATNEVLSLYVDLNQRKVVEFDLDRVKIMDDFIKNNSSKFNSDKLVFSSKLKK